MWLITGRALFNRLPLVGEDLSILTVELWGSMVNINWWMEQGSNDRLFNTFGTPPFEFLEHIHHIKCQNVFSGVIELKWCWPMCSFNMLDLDVSCRETRHTQRCYTASLDGSRYHRKYAAITIKWGRQPGHNTLQCRSVNNAAKCFPLHPHSLVMLSRFPTELESGCFYVRSYVKFR